MNGIISLPDTSSYDKYGFITVHYFISDYVLSKWGMLMP